MSNSPLKLSNFPFNSLSSFQHIVCLWKISSKSAQLSPLKLSNFPFNSLSSFQHIVCLWKISSKSAQLSSIGNSGDALTSVREKNYLLWPSRTGGTRKPANLKLGFLGLFATDSFQLWICQHGVSYHKATSLILCTLKDM